jgi:uracil-DNA glycosylase family 4
MDAFEEALAQAKITLQEMQEGAGRLPRVRRSSLQRLQRAASIRPKRAAASKSATPPATLSSNEAPTAHMTPPEDGWTWESLEAAATKCVKCPHLVANRTQVVFGTGNREADLLFVGEAPGADEDEQGEPFVGRAGGLLTKIIEAMGLTRNDIFIANVLKCRPDMPPGESGNRKPKAEEMATCLPWLKEQIALLRPKAIVALGATAAEGLLGETGLMRDLRGKWFEYDGVPTLVTYHPAYLLRNASLTEKRKVWEDMMLVMDQMGLTISAKQQGYFLPKD